MISYCQSQVVTWSTSCPPSFTDINVNVLVYNSGVLCTNFCHMDCCEKLEQTITGSNQLQRRGQGKFCGTWEVHCSIPYLCPQEPLVQPRMTVRHWHTTSNATHPMPAASIQPQSGWMTRSPTWGRSHRRPEQIKPTAVRCMRSHPYCSWILR